MNQKLLKNFGFTHEEFSDHAIAQDIGISTPALNNFRSGVATTQDKTVNKLLSWYSMSAIRRIIEFYPIKYDENYEKRQFMFLDKDKESDKYVEKTLRETRGGIYIFYDSYGQALYVGKTNGILITEIIQQFEKIKIEIYLTDPPPNTTHKPLSKQKKQKLSSKQIKKRDHYPLYNCATYLSVYHITQPALIHNLEALLIRAFPNNIINKQMAKFQYKLKKTNKT